MKNLINILGVLLIVFSIISCGNESTNDSTNLESSPSLSKKQESDIINVLNNSIKCGAYASIEETMIEDIPSIISVIISSDAVCDNNDKISEKILELSKGQQIMFHVMEESSATIISDDRIAYRFLQVGFLKIGDKDYNARLYYNAGEGQKLSGSIVPVDEIPGLEKEKMIIEIKNRK